MAGETEGGEVGGQRDHDHDTAGDCQDGPCEREPAEEADEGDDVDDKGDSKPRKSAATRLVDLAIAECELWRGGVEACATLWIGDHHEHHRLKSREFKAWLARLAYDRDGRAPGSAALADAINVLNGRALWDSDGAEHEIFIRVAGAGDRVYLDLCDPQWRVVEIGPDGWRVVGDVPIKFLRRATMRPLPEPERGGRVDDLRQHLRVADAAWPLVAGWLVGALAARGPYPVLALRGAQGSGKSNAARRARSLVDPSAAPLRSEPRQERDLLVSAAGAWVLAIDNVSSLSRWLSDSLCRIATGGGSVVRALYTDDDEHVIDVQRPVILTGITDVVEAPDLLDRTLLVELEPMSEADRRTEGDLLAEWERARPRILGALLDAVACALRRLPEISLVSLPRMADWARWATAAEPALGLPNGAVLAALEGTRAEAVAIALDGAAISAPLRELVGTASGGEWIGTHGQLLAALTERTPERVTRDARAWPKNAKALAEELGRLKPTLAQVGIEIDKVGKRGHRSERVIRIRVRPSAPSAPSASDPRASSGPSAPSAPSVTPEPSPPETTETSRITAEADGAGDADGCSAQPPTVRGDALIDWGDEW